MDTGYRDRCWLWELILVIGKVDAGHKYDGYRLEGWMVVTEIDLVTEMGAVCCNDRYWLQRWIFIAEIDIGYRNGYCLQRFMLLMAVQH